MGYRLTICDPKTGEIINDSKLYSYITDDEMRSCRSLQWLIENHKLDDYEDPYTCWDYGFYHYMYLNHSEFIEFIVRYVMDRNDYYYDEVNYCDSIENYRAALDLPWVKIYWC